MAAKVTRSPKAVYTKNQAHPGMGDNDQAMAWLEKGFEARADFLVYLNVDLAFTGLRSDPRFLSLLSRIGFPH